MKDSKPSDWMVRIIKISIISFVGFYLIGNFLPFYEGVDTYTLSMIAIHIANGEYIVTNELLEKTGRIEFVPGDWGITVDGKNTFPLGPIGFHLLSTAVYLAGGYYGLFYFGPISAIIFLILAERFATKFFGKYVGLFTLLFLATNHLVYRATLNLQTDAIFTIFFIIGCYYLIKFFKNKIDLNIFLASLFFVFSTFMRINGVIFFPIEIILISAYSAIKINSERKTRENLRENFSSNFSMIFAKFFSKRTLKISILISLPWIAFFIFWFGYNDYFFGDPLTNYRYAAKGDSEPSSISNLLTIDKKLFDNAKQFQKWLLPYQFPSPTLSETASFQKIDQVLGKHWLGYFSLLILIISLLISFKLKQNKLELIIFIFLIGSTIWFYSGLTSESNASDGVPGRYMFPAFTLFYIILGFVIVKFLNQPNNYKSNFFRNLIKTSKISFVVILILFFGIAFYFSPAVEAIKNDNFNLNNPSLLIEGHPPELEGLSENSVILALQTDRVLEYNLIPFKVRTDEKNMLPNSSIDLLKSIMEDDYDVYVFKKPTTSQEKSFLIDLTKNYNFVLTDYSKTFCKLNFVNESEQSPFIPLKSDDSCLSI